MRRRGLVRACGAAVVALGVTTVVLLSPWPGAWPWDRRPLVVAAYVSGWDEVTAGSLGTALDQGVTEVSPVLATVVPDGSLLLAPLPQEEQSALHRRAVSVIPTMQNIAGGHWDGPMVSDVLTDPAATGRHVRAIVDAAVDGEWDGVDIDYEELPPTAGPAFTDFLTSLRDQLHAHRMVLSVALPARTADESDARTLAYPYPLIGRIADEVRVMAYDHSYSTSTPGSVAPLSWVEAVVSYAVDRIPRARLMLGLAIYGYDWTGTSGQDIGGADAARLAARYGLQPRWDGATASWTFVYEQDGQRHTVWYEDARSIEAKQQVAIRNRLRGLGIWRIGGEDPQLWTAVAHAAAGSAP